MNFNDNQKLNKLTELLKDVKSCTECKAYLPLGPRPVLQLSSNARILIVGQAPGIKVHNSGVPFDDQSGNRLREWMGIDKDTFYDEQKIAILPMGFCYPGKGKSGDLPPRPECAKKWREDLLNLMPNIQTTLIIGQYALNWHLKHDNKKNLTETVKAWREYSPSIIPLPHPSPRNNIWLKKNAWFEVDVLPELKQRITDSL